MAPTSRLWTSVSGPRYTMRRTTATPSASISSSNGRQIRTACDTLEAPRTSWHSTFAKPTSANGLSIVSSLTLVIQFIHRHLEIMQRRRPRHGQNFAQRGARCERVDPKFEEYTFAHCCTEWPPPDRQVFARARGSCQSSQCQLLESIGADADDY